MKYSIRRQMTAIFIGLFACILGAVLIINNGFLGRYYLSHKAKDLVRTYYAVDDGEISISLSWTAAARRSFPHWESRIRD